ncbi:MAG: putative protein kinase [Streblomastix strix]|uniref:non-specific serine/threonine protein kinase n=1 Tax=Streblomastix strix TaxID=222440 RepID=A0A5J4WTZ1_9EUKA|nr:MAG: putative protein kinase [Streblomastix strix]
MSSQIIDSQRWNIIKTIGHGAHSTVYEVERKFHLNDDFSTKSKQINEKLAIKVANAQENSIYLDAEAELMKILGETKFFCKFIENGIFPDGRSYIVEELLNQTLSQRINSVSGIISLQSSLLIARQCLKIIETFHHAGFVHNDIKPDNFVYRLIQPDYCKEEIVLIDFGLSAISESYQLNSSIFTNVNCVQHNKASRATRYSTYRIHEGNIGTQIDDLGSWLNMSIEFSTGNLPWSHIKDRNIAGEMKKRLSIADVVQQSGADAVFLQLGNIIESESITHIPLDYRPLFDIIDNRLQQLIFNIEPQQIHHISDDDIEMKLIDWDSERKLNEDNKKKGRLKQTKITDIILPTFEKDDDSKIEEEDKSTTKQFKQCGMKQFGQHQGIKRPGSS